MLFKAEWDGTQYRIYCGEVEITKEILVDEFKLEKSGRPYMSTMTIKVFCDWEA